MSSIILKAGPSLNRLTRSRLRYETDALLRSVKGRKVDPFEAHDQEVALRGAIYCAWQSHLEAAAHQISQIHSNNSLFSPSIGEVHSIMYVLNTNLNSDTFSRAVRYAGQPVIGQTFAIGKKSVDHQYRKQTGADPVKKVTSTFGVLFGLTEDHALQGLTDQLTLSAGSFWSDQMSNSIRKEMESWFSGSLTRQELAEKLRAMVNDRLSIEGKKSLPGSYFDSLAEHYIVRSRNVGSVYRGKELGAKKYKIMNPNDTRTSSICRAVSQPGVTFQFADAENTTSAIVGARSLSGLKQAVPFLTDANAHNAIGPVPPLHWKCRSWMQYVFGILD